MAQAFAQVQHTLPYIVIDNAFLKEVVVSRSCVLFLPVGHREGGPEGQVFEREGGREPGWGREQQVGRRDIWRVRHLRDGWRRDTITSL